MDHQPIPAPIADFARAEMARLEVPGLSVGVLHDGVMYAGGFGVTNVDYPAPVDADTLFQIGSTSKTFTATALMRLVESGHVDLDATVRTYLPTFALESEADAAALTVRQLATHHAGFVGDYFRDTGRGDDALATIVGKMARSRQLTPAGYTFSYSNAGFYVLGHIVATVMGMPFEQAIRETIFEPLGMDRSFYFPEEMMTYRVAAGHIRTADGPRVARPWNTPRSIAPGGGVTSTVVDQLRYAALHIGQGAALHLGQGAAPVLKPETIAYMQQRHAEAGSMCEHIGISWMLDGEGADRIVKHGGATNGHLSSFEMLPGRGYAVTVLTNSDSGREARQTVADACRRHFLGSELALPQADPALAAGSAQYAGVYRAVLATLRVAVGPEGPSVVDESPERQFAERRLRPLPPEPAPIAFYAPDRAVVLEGSHRGERCEFLRDAGGAIAWMRWDGRIARREG
jgi:CubicO group peptidase (beta-lactamase class C family)